MVARSVIVFFAFVHATLPVQPTFPGTPLREKTLAYVLVDSTFSEEAVQTVCKAAVRLHEGNNSTTRQTLNVVNVTRTEGACLVVDNSAVIHLSRACLPNYAARLRPPILSVPGDQVHASGSLTVHVSFGHGDSSELPVLLAVASKLNWTSAVYVGDADADIPLLDQLLRRIRTFELSDVVPVREGADPISLYTTITDSDVDFVLVHCQSYFCYEIVKELFYLRNEMTGQGSSVPWLMTEPLTKQSQSGSAPGSLTVPSTTYGLQMVLPNNPHSDFLLEDVSSLEKSHRECSTLEHCPSTVEQQVLDFYDSLAVLLHLIGHSRQTALQSSGSLVRFINEANLEGISGYIQFDQSSSERTYPTLYNVLDISPFLVATIGVYDTCSSGWLHKLRPLSEENSWRRGRFRRTLPKCAPALHTYRLTTMREPPFVIYDPNKTLDTAHSDNYTGLVVEMLEMLSKQMGFTYKMSEPPDLKYGSINERGEGNGMVGQLMNCDADLAAAAFAITSARSSYIHFTKPYIDVGKSLLAYREDTARISFWAFLNHFGFTTKLVIVASLVVVSIVFALLGKLSPYRSPNELKSTGCRERCSVAWPTNSFWFFYTTSMQQGPDVVPSVSGKILAAGWFFFCLVIVTTYTANLAAFRTVKSFAGGVNSLDDLEAQTKIRYGTVRDTSVIDFFKNSQLGVHQRMYAQMIRDADVVVDTAEEAIDRVKEGKGKYVFIWDEPILDYIASTEPCNTRVVGRAFNAQGYGLAMPQGMPYQLNFSLAILNLRETGEVERLAAKWFNAGECDIEKTVQDLTDVEKVRITDMLGVFVILASAVGASVLVAIMERVWWNLTRRQKVDISNGPDAVAAPEVFKAPKVVKTTARKRDSESESD